jgi:hypothetical protein
MNNFLPLDDHIRPARRRMLQATAVAALSSTFLSRVAAGENQPATEPAAGGRLSNGGAGPFPIPWLDKNGNHNQPAGPNLEPSHVYHFKGRVGRCAGFTGVGTDNAGNRLGFGTKTTDFGFMDGEYFAARAAQRVPLTHI